MVYGLDIWKEDGKCIEPGYFEGPLWKSDSPIPVPSVGEIILAAGDTRWRVKEREFEYGYVDNTNEVFSLVRLTVTPA